MKFWFYKHRSAPQESTLNDIQALRTKDFRATHRATQKPGKSLLRTVWDKYTLWRFWNFSKAMMKRLTLRTLVVNWNLKPIAFKFLPVLSSATSHKGLKSPKRFTNLPLGSMSSYLNLISLMHSYRSLGLPRATRSYNALIEVFKFISGLTPIYHNHIKIEVCEPFRRR